MREAKLTWPRHIHTILKCNVDDSTVMMADKWCEFMEAGPGTLYDDDDPGLILQDMGMACSFDDFAGEDKVAVVQSSEAESSDSYLWAIFEAALQVSRRGVPVKPEVMIPLLGHVEELRLQKQIVLEAAEEVARDRGCRQVIVSSFTFQAPALYERHGYVEVGRTKGLPVQGSADVHFVKTLG